MPRPPLLVLIRDVEAVDFHAVPTRLWKQSIFRLHPPLPVPTRDVEVVDFYATSTASASTTSGSY